MLNLAAKLNEIQSILGRPQAHWEWKFLNQANSDITIGTWEPILKDNILVSGKVKNCDHISSGRAMKAGENGLDLWAFDL